MPYLLKTQHNQFILLHHTTKNGLCYQLFSSTGIHRPICIHRTNAPEYTAALDEDDILHIIYKTSRSQIIHFTDSSSQANRDTLLDDPKNSYNFSNLHVVFWNNQLHLFYIATNPVRKFQELVHHIICAKSDIAPSSITKVADTQTPYQCIKTNDSLMILYLESDEEYRLNLIKYEPDKNAWSDAVTLATSPLPIAYYQLCISSEGIYHLLYTEENYGKCQFLYLCRKKDWSTPLLLHTSVFFTKPIIFLYHNTLWINWIEDHTLKMMLSTNNGASFSNCTDCTLQSSDITTCYYVPSPSFSYTSLAYGELYATLLPTPKLGIISQIDMDPIHPDHSPNSELELILHSTSSRHPCPSPYNSEKETKMASAPYENKWLQEKEALKQENIRLQQIQDDITQKYNDMAELAKKIQEEGKRWRNRALMLEQELDELTDKEH